MIMCVGPGWVDGDIGCEYTSAIVWLRGVCPISVGSPMVIE